MSLVPAFELGLWNAWILTLVFVILRTASSGKVSQKTEGRINVLINWVLFLLFVYSVFLPLPLGTVWFYTGLSVFLFGGVLFRIAGLPWAITPAHEPVTTGLYRYSRHPYYLAMLVQLVGIAIASASWVFLLSSILLIVLMNILMGKEEAFCLKMYGKDYRKYMNRTPRWMEIPKSGGK